MTGLMIESQRTTVLRARATAALASACLSMPRSRPLQTVAHASDGRSCDETTGVVQEGLQVSAERRRRRPMLRRNACACALPLCEVELTAAHRFVELLSEDRARFSQGTPLRPCIPCLHARSEIKKPPREVAVNAGHCKRQRLGCGAAVSHE